jgi:DNA polymerase III alpha subunit
MSDRDEREALAYGLGPERASTLPQLRCRTEFSFRQAFGPVARVAEAAKAAGASAAGIVDGSTWGHVRWAKAAAKAGIKPLFGTELTVPLPDGRKPQAWALAEDTRGFYRFSTALRRRECDAAAILRESSGVIRFAGTGLTDPELFDYIDLNPSSPMEQRAAVRLHKATGKPLVVTSANSYPTRGDYDAFVSIGGREATTPQHLLTEQELRAHIRVLDDNLWAQAVRNTHEVAERCAGALPTAPIIQVAGDLRALAAAGKHRRLSLGHLPAWPEHYEARLHRELEAIEAKDFNSYFIVVSDLIDWAKQRMLVGPGRGSSAGSLLCYLLGITEVDPIPHGLLFERFIDLTRKDLPDIDIDFSDVKREQCFDYLADKYGRSNVARIGNVNTLKPRSVMAEVCKRFGIPDKERFDLLNVLIEYSSGDSRYGKGLEDTLHNTDTGRRFMQKYPNAIVMSEVENHAWHTGVHAAGVIVCNVPVDEYCTVGEDGVAHIDKPDSEYLNLLKIDALGLRTLGIIEDAGVTTSDELYALKLDDPAVLEIFNQRKYTGIFQFEGQSQRTISAQVHVDDFRTVDHLTALARPGPLGGGATGKYIARKAGLEPVTYTHPSLEELLGDTYGVVLYQEQVMRIVRDIGKFSWDETTVIRKAMSGRKGKEFFDQQGAKFIAGAAQDGIDAAKAQEIWNEICNFGAWGMNKSHTCAYAVISYWCAWMKAYHPLEYAAACLRSAKDDDQTMEILREMAREGVDYVAFDPELSEVNWAVREGQLMGGFTNLVGFGPAKAVAAVEARRLGKTDDKLRARIAAAHVKFSDLYPISHTYAALYADPEAHGCRAGSVIYTADRLPETGSVLFIGKIAKKELRDENETVRVARRDGRRLTGQTLFADFFLKDDTGIPMICRIDRFSYEPLGRIAMERLVAEQDVLLVRGKKIPNFGMIKIERIKVLNREELLQ